MLPAYIIEELRRREQSREPEQRPTLDLPLPVRPAPRADQERGASERGVVIIDLGS